MTEARVGDDRQVVLYAEQHDHNSYHLRASRGKRGTLVFSGQDLGASVEDHFGYPEYEYTITLPRKQVRRLMQVLGEKGDVLDAVEKHLATDVAWRLRTWFDEHGIEWEFWSRTGP